MRFLKKKKEDSGYQDVLPGLDLSSVEALLTVATDGTRVFEVMAAPEEFPKECDAIVGLLKRSSAVRRFDHAYTFFQLVELAFIGGYESNDLLSNFVDTFLGLSISEFKEFDTFLWDARGKRDRLSIRSFSEFADLALRVKKTILSTSMLIPRFVLSSLTIDMLRVETIVPLSRFIKKFKLSKTFMRQFSEMLYSESLEDAILIIYFSLESQRGQVHRGYCFDSVKRYISLTDPDDRYLNLIGRMIVLMSKFSIEILKLVLDSHNERVIESLFRFLAAEEIKPRVYDAIIDVLLEKAAIYSRMPNVKMLFFSIVQRQISSYPESDYDREIKLAIFELRKSVKKSPEITPKILKFLLDVSIESGKVRKLLIRTKLIDGIFSDILQNIRPIPRQIPDLVEELVSGKHKDRALLNKIVKSLHPSILLDLAASLDATDSATILSIFVLLIVHGIYPQETLQSLLELLKVSVSTNNTVLAELVAEKLVYLARTDPAVYNGPTLALARELAFMTIDIYGKERALLNRVVEKTLSLLCVLARISDDADSMMEEFEMKIDSYVPESSSDICKFYISVAYDLAFLRDALPSINQFPAPGRAPNLQVGDRIRFPKLLEWSIRKLFLMSEKHREKAFASKYLRNLWTHVQLNYFNQDVLCDHGILSFIFKRFERHLIFGAPSETFDDEAVRMSKNLILCTNPRVLAQKYIEILSHGNFEPGMFDIVLMSLKEMSRALSFPSHFDFSNAEGLQDSKLLLFRNDVSEFSADISIVFYFKYELDRWDTEEMPIFEMTLETRVIIRLYLFHSHFTLGVLCEGFPEKLFSMDSFDVEKNKFYLIGITLENLRTAALYVNGFCRQTVKTGKPHVKLAPCEEGEGFALAFGKEMEHSTTTYRYSIGTFILYMRVLSDNEMLRLSVLGPRERNYLGTQCGSLLNKIDDYLLSDLKDLSFEEIRRALHPDPSARRDSFDAYSRASQWRNARLDHDDGVCPILQRTETLFLIDNNVDKKERRLFDLIGSKGFVAEYDSRVLYHKAYDIFRDIRSAGGLGFVFDLSVHVKTSETLFSLVTLVTRYIEYWNDSSVPRGRFGVSAYRYLSHLLSVKLKSGIKIHTKCLTLVMIHLGLHSLKRNLSVVRFPAGITEFVLSAEIWGQLDEKHTSYLRDTLVYFVRGNRYREYNMSVFRIEGVLLRVIDLGYQLEGEENALVIKSLGLLFRQILNESLDSFPLTGIRNRLVAHSKVSAGDHKESSMSAFMASILAVYGNLERGDRAARRVFREVFGLRFVRDLLVFSGRDRDVVCAVRTFVFMNYDVMEKMRHESPDAFDDLFIQHLPQRIREFDEVRVPLFMLLFEITRGKASSVNSKNITRLSIVNEYYVLPILRILHALKRSSLRTEEDTDLEVAFVSLLYKHAKTMRRRTVFSDARFIPFLTDLVLDNFSVPNRTVEAPDEEYRLYLDIIICLILNDFGNYHAMRDRLTHTFWGIGKSENKEHFSRLATELIARLIFECTDDGHILRLSSGRKVDKGVVKSFALVTSFIEYLICSVGLPDLEFSYFLLNLEMLRNILDSNVSDGGGGTHAEDTSAGEVSKTLSKNRLFSYLNKTLVSSLGILIYSSQRNPENFLPILKHLQNNTKYLLSEFITFPSEIDALLKFFVIYWAHRIVQSDECSISDPRGALRMLEELWGQTRAADEDEESPTTRKFLYLKSFQSVLSVIESQPVVASSFIDAMNASVEEIFERNSSPPIPLEESLGGRPAPSSGEQDTEIVEEVHALRALKWYESFESEYILKLLGVAPEEAIRGGTEYDAMHRDKKAFILLVFRLLERSGRRPLAFNSSCFVIADKRQFVPALMVMTRHVLYLFSHYETPFRPVITVDFSKGPNPHVRIDDHPSGMSVVSISVPTTEEEHSFLATDYKEAKEIYNIIKHFRDV